MYRELKKLGQVDVVAPDMERSSISQAITLNHPLYHRKIVVDGKMTAHALSGTPTDCVKFGVAVIARKKPDLIVSGINNGSNDGCSVFYSGTVAGAREGALLKIPSIAVSLDINMVGQKSHYETAAKVGLAVARWVTKTGLPAGTFLNVNVPDVPLKQCKSVRFACQCKVPIHGEFQKRVDPAGRPYYWLTGRPLAGQQECTSDSYLLKRGYAVVAPVHCDSTDRQFLEQYQSSGEEIHW